MWDNDNKITFTLRAIVKRIVWGTWNLIPWTRLWPENRILWLRIGRQHGRRVPSINPQQLGRGAPAAWIASAKVCALIQSTSRFSNRWWYRLYMSSSTYRQFSSTTFQRKSHSNPLFTCLVRLYSIFLYLATVTYCCCILDFQKRLLERNWHTPCILHWLLQLFLEFLDLKQ